MRRLMFLLAAVASLFLIGSNVVMAGPDRTVRITGDEQFVPNALIMATLRFAPGPITVNTGDTVTWPNLTDEPHTITIVDASDVPTSLGEVFECTAPGGPCFPALVGHFSSDPPVFVLGGGADGTAGLDGVGDSLLVFPGGSISGVVTALSGATLSYLCAIHPWMIGSIDIH